MMPSYGTEISYAGCRGKHAVVISQWRRWLHRLAGARSYRVAQGIRNSFQRLSSSSGGTSSTCVAIHQIFPKGSFTPPYRSPLGSVMRGKTEMPPTLSARLYTLSESLT